MLPNWKTLRNQPLLLASLLVAMGVYAKTIAFPGISWDDPEMVFANKAVVDFDLKVLLTHHFVGNYTPVTMVVYAILYKLIGDWAGGYHLLNFTLHLLNGLFIYTLSQRIFQRNQAALFATIIFLLHPLQIESVVWISELKNILSTTFLLFSLHFFLHYMQTPKARNFLLVVLFSLLAFLSKPSTVVIPVLMVLLLFLKNKSIRFFELALPIGIGLIAVLVGLHTINTQKADHFINYSHFYDWSVRIGLAGFAIVNYLRLLALPIKLSVIYPFPEVNTINLVLGYTALLVIFGALIVFWIKEQRHWIFIIAWALAVLLPVLQLLPFGEVLYADRYMYLTVLAMGWLIGFSLPEELNLTKWLSGACILLLGVSSFSRVSDWRNSTQLYKSILKIYPNEYVTLNSLGVEMMNNHFDSESLHYLNLAIKASPNNYKGYFNRGLLALKNRKANAAISDFNKVLSMYDYTKAWSGRAAAYLLMQDYAKAMSDAREALKRDKRNLKAHFVLAGCNDAMGNIESALKEYSTCIEIAGGDPETYLGRAIVFGKLQDYKNAEADLNAALSLRPDFYEAYYWRAVVRINTGRSGCDDLSIAAQHQFTPAIGAYQKYCR